MQSVGQKKNKTHRKRCNAKITRVLNTSEANYKIRFPDDPLWWNFSRRIPTRDLS